MKKEHQLLGTFGLVAACMLAGCGNESTDASSAGGDESELVQCYGINECAGTAECAGNGHDCQGLNECAGQGFITVEAEECESEGGTTTPPDSEES